jgi:hypothetical protein
MAQELNAYITKARDKKLTDEQIKNQLNEVGWSTEQITEALAQESDLPVPPIPPVTHVGMWTGFLYTIFFISLYILSLAIAGIFNIWIDKPLMVTTVNNTSNALGGALINNSNSINSPYDFLSSTFNIDMTQLVRAFVAAIIVSYPVFLFISILLKKQLKTQPSIRSLRSRKVLIYLTLIMTFLILLGDIVIGIYDFLAGSITSITIRHLLVTILISGPIFIYFITEVKNDRKIT